MGLEDRVAAASKLEEVYRARGDWSSCIRTLRRAASLVPDTERVDWLSRAALIEVDARHDRGAAKEIYDQILTLQPDHGAALRFQAEWLTSAEGPQSLESFERLESFMADRDDLDDFDVRLEVSSFYSKLAQAYLEAGRGDDAVPRFERALELNPAHLHSLQSVAPLYFERKDWKNAQKVLRQILQLTGGQGEPAQVAQTYTELGMVERGLGHQDKAQKRFTKALEIVPNHVGALKGMALILEDRQDWTTLLNVYNNIIFHAPVEADVLAAYLIKGRILDEKLNRHDKAASHYEGGLAIKPNQPRVVLRLAELALRRGDWQDALAQADRGLALEIDNRDRADLLVVRATAHAAQGESDAASMAFAEARAADSAVATLTSVDDHEVVREFVAARLQANP